MGFDDEEWDDMPVIQPSISSLDTEDRKKYNFKPSNNNSSSYQETSSSPTLLQSSSTSGNATGKLVDIDAVGTEWREKNKLDEMDYTRLELDDDPEEDEISMRTQYLFNEEKGMTPLSQMQATKTLLTEGQRIAYVGVCRLIAREMVQTLVVSSRGSKELEASRESAKVWSNKIMGRLYRHMEVDAAEQRMMEQLAEHGVTAEDLVPSLLATYTVDNPEYDPEAVADLSTEDTTTSSTLESNQENSNLLNQTSNITETKVGLNISINPFGQDEEELEPNTPKPKSGFQSTSISKLDPFDDDYSGGDIGGALGGVSIPPTLPPLDINTTSPSTPPQLTARPISPTLPTTPRQPQSSSSVTTTPKTPSSSQFKPVAENLLNPLPSSLPGVSTTLTALDKTITLDIRWTILCDLFLSLIADSVYDARSRVLLGKIADRLGLEWMDVVRFERRLTEALEIQEGVQQKEHGEVLEDQRKKGQRSRYVMMGLATLGGGLVIGLSAGLLAPVIGAGLGAALTTVGVTGTTGFLAGAGGAAVISSGATITGSIIGGKAMAKRTRHVKTFEFQPLHNNKRVNFFITVPGFMNGPLDDVRLPFSTIDPVMGDVFSVLWEPEMMGDTGNALKILTTEVFTQVGQQVLAMTVMTALLSALQWPLMLTKLGYLIDNPWSNALDRARQAGAVLADILISRHMGVRPVSLVGFSLGARVIFYCLVELAKAKAFGVVQDVYLFGATVTAPKAVWHSVRGVVSGRFVNAYAMNDWVLGYLFRATSGGLNTVAGLRPVEYVPDLENVDITSILVGHMSYRTLMPTLLAHVGFKVTADHFDEPEEMEQDTPDREVLTKEEEEKRKEKKERSKMGIFSRRKKSAASTTSGTSSPSMSRENSTEGDDEDLPPRMVPKMTHSKSNLSVSSTNSTGSYQLDEEDDEREVDEKVSIEVPIVEKGEPAGFNLDKLREELAQVENNNTNTTTTNLSPSSIPLPLSSPSPSSFNAYLPPTDLSTLESSNINLDPRELLRRQWAGESIYSAPLPRLPTPVMDNSWVTNPFASTTSFTSDPSITSSPSPPSSNLTRSDSRTSFSFASSSENEWGSSNNNNTFGSSNGKNLEKKSSFEDLVPDPAGLNSWGNTKSTMSTTNLGYRTQNPW